MVKLGWGKGGLPGHSGAQLNWGWTMTAVNRTGCMDFVPPVSVAPSAPMEVGSHDAV